MTPTFLVLLREAGRQARRPRTWVIRFAVTALLLGLVAIAAGEHTVTDVSQLGYLGQTLFRTWFLLVAPFVLLVAPLTVAAGVLEEREDETLPLLVLSGLSPAAILLGKVASRLLLLLTVVLGSLPVLASIVTLGGVAVHEVVIVVAILAVVAIELGLFAAFLSLVTRRGPLLPTLFALAWGVPATILPFAMLPNHATWDALVPVIVHLPVLATVAALMLPVFRIVTTDEPGDELGALSPDVWLIERFRRRTWLAALGFVGFLVLWALVDRFGLPNVATQAAGWLAATVALCIAARLYLLAGLATARWQWIALPGRGWRHADEPRRVWHNPVLWRDLRTRSSIGLQRLLRGAAMLFAGMLLLGWYVEGVDVDVHLPLTVLAWGGAFFVAPLLITGSWLEERKARTLPLLAMSPLGVRGVVTGKVGALLARLLPWVFVGWLLWATLPTGVPDVCYHDNHLFGELLWPGQPLVRRTLVALWAGVVLVEVGLLASVCALRMSPRVAWAAAVAVPFGWLLLAAGPELARELFRYDRDLATGLTAVWVPWGDDVGFRCSSDGTPRAVLVSIYLHTGLAAALAALTARLAARRG